MIDELMGNNFKEVALIEIMEKLREALKLKKTIILVGNCMVDYSGRAKSSLDYGDRIILVKQDGALLIHRPYGYLPVNWQPSRCHFHISFTNDLLNLKAVRVSPPEAVLITFRQVYLMSGVRLEDEGQFSLYASELEMKKAIVIQPDLIEPNFKILSYEKKIKPGFIDVYGCDHNGNHAIVEIKRNIADKEAILQLHKYMSALPSEYPLRGIIAAPALRRGCQRLLKALNLEFKQVDPQLCSQILAKKGKSSHDHSIGEYFK